MDGGSMFIKLQAGAVLTLGFVMVSMSGCSHGGGSTLSINTNAGTPATTSSPTNTSITTSPSASPTPAPTSTPPPNSNSGSTVSIGVGGGHVCAVNGGGVYCWGDNTEGSLGNNSQTSTNTPVQVSGLGAGSGATYVPRLSTYSSCALVSGGVKCWGENSDGASGNGGTAPSNAFPCGASGQRDLQ